MNGHEREKNHCFFSQRGVNTDFSQRAFPRAGHAGICTETRLNQSDQSSRLWVPAYDRCPHHAQNISKNIKTNGCVMFCGYEFKSCRFWHLRGELTFRTIEQNGEILQTLDGVIATFWENHRKQWSVQDLAKKKLVPPKYPSKPAGIIHGFPFPWWLQWVQWVPQESPWFNHGIPWLSLRDLRNPQSPVARRCNSVATVAASCNEERSSSGPTNRVLLRIFSIQFGDFGGSTEHKI